MASSRKDGASSAPRPDSPPVNGTKQPKRKTTKARKSAVERPLLVHVELANNYDLMNECHRVITRVFNSLPEPSRETFDALRRRLSVQLRNLKELLDVAEEDADAVAQDDGTKGGDA